MDKKKIVVSSSHSGNGQTGSIIIRRGTVRKEVKAVLFSCSEAKILREYIDKRKP